MTFFLDNVDDDSESVSCKRERSKEQCVAVRRSWVYWARGAGSYVAGSGLGDVCWDLFGVVIIVGIGLVVVVGDCFEVVDWF
jgi:hypothetical protein